MLWLLRVGLSERGSPATPRSRCRERSRPSTARASEHEPETRRARRRLAAPSGQASRSPCGPWSNDTRSTPLGSIRGADHRIAPVPPRNGTERSASGGSTSQALAGAVMNGRIPATVLNSTWASSARTRPMWLSPVRDLVHVTVSPAATVHEVGFNTVRRSVDPRSRRRFTSICWALRDRPARDEAALRHGG